MLVTRNEAAANRKIVATSADGATGWSKPEFHDQLWEPVCMAGMGVHSLNWASMLLGLSKASGDGRLRQRAIQTANYATYYLQPDNRIMVGFQYNQWWYSCHAGVILYMLDFAEN